MKEKERNSSIDLLKIIAMFFIVISHCCVHGIGNYSSSYMINSVLLNVLTLGNLGVALFVCITGYLLIEKEIKIKRLIMLELQIIFYSVVLYAISCLILKKSIFSFEIIKCAFPIIFKKYWFMTAYFILYFFVPFINKLLNVLNKKENRNLLLICVILVFFIPTITTFDLYFNEIVQFFTFYIVGAYIRKYYNDFKKINSVRIVLYTTILLLVLFTTVIVFFSKKYPFLLNFGTYFLNRNSIFVLVIASCMLIIFLRKRIKNNVVINKISISTLGVYLIHDNQYFREILWNKVFKLNQFVNSQYLFIIIITVAFLIFISCIFIEKIRMFFFNRLNNKLADKIDKIIRSFWKIGGKNEEKNRNNEHAKNC